MKAVISFMLGQRSLAVFTEFVEKLQVAEPANLLRLATGAFRFALALGFHFGPWLAPPLPPSPAIGRRNSSS